MASLTQRDIDNLVQILEHDKPADDVPLRNLRRHRVYDFRRPDKFSKDALRVLQFLHENYARALTTFLSGQIRSMATVLVSSVDQMTFEEYCQLLPNPCVTALLTLSPLPSTGFLEIHPSLAFPIIDRLFGGPGRQQDSPRTLTEIEVTVVKRLMDGTLRVLAESWIKVAQISPKIQAIETNPLFAQILAPNETVVVITLEVRIGNHAGPLNLVLPHLLLEPLLPSLSAHQWFGALLQTGEPGNDDGQIASNLTKVGVDIAAILGSCQLTVRELLSLENGDVVALRTPADGDVGILVGGKQKFWGKPGCRGKKLAVQITRSSLEQGGNDDE